MKLLVIALLCVVVYQSDESRVFLSNQLQNASDLIRPTRQTSGFTFPSITVGPWYELTFRTSIWFL